MRLRSSDDLRSIYRPARGTPVDKVIHQLDQHCFDFLTKSPLFVLSTADADGVCDGSPKGGPPGFVEALDKTRVAWADYSGNNRLDSFENLIANDSVGLLFMIPGLDETLRINGTAELSTETSLCERFAIKGSPARVVVVVTVTEAYVHCAKALRRASLWDTASWAEDGVLPSGTKILRDHAGLDTDLAPLEDARKRDHDSTLWRPGGDPPG